MEPHPVPQNIIDVEFKLFGAFSLRQFGQILIGCMVGVVIYFIPVIPFIVKVPLIFLAVVFGLLSAFIPYFGTWLFGFAKALIVAPRYVWVKEPARSDILQAASSQTTKVGDKEEPAKIDSLDNLAIADVSVEKDDVLEDFLAEGTTTSEKDNFKNLYDKVYADNLASKPVSENLNKSELPNASEPAVENVSTPTKNKVLSEKDILVQIEKLRDELRLLSRNDDKEKESLILNKINDLYSQYKVLKNETVSSPKTASFDAKQFLKPQKGGKLVFGIVVSKSDKAIANAQVSLINSETKEVFKGISSNDGKFATASKVPFGNYDVVIAHKDYKFHTYRIEVSESRMPAFKFREK